jgi:hypothetical protein
MEWGSFVVRPGRGDGAGMNRALGRTVTLVLSLLVLAAAAPGWAANCGDDVNGERVACACGDVVVSDTALSATDPVVSRPCSRDGLVLLARDGADEIRLDLSGLTIRGQGRGVGIRVVRGGALGAVIVGGDGARGSIARFDTGIHGSGRSAVREVRGVNLVANRRDGLNVRSSGVRLSDVHSEGNGRDGVRVSGHGLDVTGVTAVGNGSEGLDVRGTSAYVEATLEGNGRNGVVVSGRGHHLGDIVSRDNGGAGVLATGVGHQMRRSTMSKNRRGDVAGRKEALR